MRMMPLQSKILVSHQGSINAVATNLGDTSRGWLWMMVARKPEDGLAWLIIKKSPAA